MVNSETSTHLHEQCIAADLEAVEQLLKNGADPNMWIDEYGYPIDYAVQTQNDALMALLLRYGADIDRPMEEIYKGLTRLQLYAAIGHFTTVKFLLRHGADSFSVDISKKLTRLGIKRYRSYTREKQQEMKQIIREAQLASSQTS